MKPFFHLFSCLALIAALFAAGCAGRPVAKVNGVPISQQDYQKGLEHGTGLSEEFQAGRIVLDTLIGIRLIEKEATQKNITVSEEELNKALEEYKKSIQVSTNVPFDEFLKKTGITLEDAKNRARLSVLLKKLVVSDMEIEEYFKAQGEKLNRPEQVTFWEALFLDQKGAADFRQSLQDKKQDFLAAAQAWQNSGKQIIAPPAGPKQTVPVDKLGEALGTTLKDALLGLQPGGFAEPKATEVDLPIDAQGNMRKFKVWAVVSLVSKDPAFVATLENTRDDIRQRLYLEKNYSGEVARYVNELKSRARIEILDPTYASLSEDYKKLAEIMPKPNIPEHVHGPGCGHDLPGGTEAAPAPPGTTAP